jgi:phosphotriesterase-related protein
MSTTQATAGPTQGISGRPLIRRSLIAVAGSMVLAASMGVGATTAQDESEPVFYTTAGPLERSEIGDVLAHHHMFVEFGAIPPTAYIDADPEMVYEVIGPWVEEAKELGIGTFVEFTPLGVGRRPDIVKAVADRAGLPTMLVTGIYREPYMPDWVYEASVEDIADFMRKELTEGVGDTGVPAGLIKVSQNATGMTLTERKILEAACIVGQETGASIASHIAAFGSTAGPTALAVIDALEGFGCSLDDQRFIWVHAGIDAAAEGTKLEVADLPGADAGFDYLLEALDRGAFVSLDSIGSPFWGPTYGDYAVGIDWITRLADAGFEDKIIIGSDTGWFDPGQPAGFELEQIDGVWTMVGTYAGDYRQIPAEFVPAMRDAGFSEELITKLMQDNPWSAYSR